MVQVRRYKPLTARDELWSIKRFARSSCQLREGQCASKGRGGKGGGGVIIEQGRQLVLLVKHEQASL